MNIKIVSLMILATIILNACNKFGSTDIPNKSESNKVSVSIDEAEDMLLEIMERMNALGTKSGDESMQKTISGRYSMTLSTETKSGDESPTVHVFNFENESGFAIMSADRRIAPLLAYTFKGNLNAGDSIDNPGLAIYMSKLNDYITVTLDTLNSDQITDKGYLIYGDVYITEMVNGYCPVKWDQYYPYNYLCPVDSVSGYKCLTGCTGTVIAQLMACYKYPESYNGYTFDWDAMIEASNNYEPPVAPPISADPIEIGGGNDSITPPLIRESVMYEPEPDSAMLQIARLMQQLGLPENLDNIYSPYGTAAYSYNIDNTLLNFNFSNGGSWIFFDELLEELSNGYYCFVQAKDYDIIGTDPPVVIPCSYEDGSGHIWLLHGLMSVKYYDLFNITYYFLCNFGWGGYADGYYLADVYNTNKGPSYFDPNVKSEVINDPGNYSYQIGYYGKIRK